MTEPEVKADASVAAQQRVSAILMGISYLFGAVGIYFGFQGEPGDFAIFCLLAVGAPTVAGFVRHVFLWRGDAQRLGFEARDPSWMWEVGFANLAIACAAILSVALDWGTKAQATVVITMGIYMLGATFVHAVSWQKKAGEERRSPVMAIGVPLAYAVLLLVIAVSNL